MTELVTTRDMFTNETKHEIVAPKPPGTIYERCERILRDFPETREDDKVFYLRYWTEYDHLDLVTVGALDFSEWFLEFATTPKTLYNRRQELMWKYPPSPRTQERRAWLAKYGKPRG